MLCLLICFPWLQGRVQWKEVRISANDVLKNVNETNASLIDPSVDFSAVLEKDLCIHFNTVTLRIGWFYSAKLSEYNVIATRVLERISHLTDVDVAAILSVSSHKFFKGGPPSLS